MLPELVSMLNECGLRTGWVVMRSDEPRLLPPDETSPQPDPRPGRPALCEEDRELYAAVSRSSLVVQNSLREGFGLTVTEARWKPCSVIGSRACGIRRQIRDGMDGRLIDDCEDPEGIAELLQEALDDRPGRTRWTRSAQRRVHDEFLVFTQVRRWMETFAEQLRA